MRKLLAAFSAALTFATLTCTVRAEKKDPADLLPADTLAYLEICQPGETSRELASLLRGSYFDNMPARLAKFRAEIGDNEHFYGDRAVASFGMFLAPEMIAEFARLQGGALALTGFSKEHEPEIVGMVLAGESNAPTFVLRTYLTMDSDARSVAEVEGVSIYRARTRDWQAQMAPRPAGQPPPPVVFKDSGPSFALLPDMIVIGSTTEGVKNVVRRARGKSAEPSLASKSAFKEAAKDRSRPGLFGYADLVKLSNQVDDMVKGGGSMNASSWAAFQQLLNLKAFRSATAGLVLQNGGVELRLRLNLDPKEPSPVLGLLPEKSVDRNLLHWSPPNALCATVVALPDGAKSWDRFLAVADEIARNAGAPAEKMPSKAIAGAEEQAKLHIGKDVLAKIAGLVMVDLPPAAGAKEGKPTMLQVIQGKDEDAARALEDTAPKLLGLATGGEVTLPGTEKFKGQTIHSLPGDALALGMPILYARQGPMLVLGQDRDAVVEALTSGTKKEGLLSDAAVADVLKHVDDPVVLGVCSLKRTLPEFPTWAGFRWTPTFHALPARSEPGVAPEKAKTSLTEEERFIRQLGKMLEPLPPAVFTVARKPDVLTLELRQPALRSVLAKLINASIDSSLEQAAGSLKARPGVGAIGVKVAPPPPVPPVPAAPPSKLASGVGRAVATAGAVVARE